MLIGLLLSAGLHWLSGSQLRGVPSLPSVDRSKREVKIRVVSKDNKPKPKPEAKPKSEPDNIPKILETPQQKTAKPEDASYAGNVDHQAEKQTRVSDKTPRDRAKDPGQKGNPEARPGVPRPEDVKADKLVKDAKPKDKKPEKKPPTSSEDMAISKNKVEIFSKGNLAIGAEKPKARNPYESLLPTGIADLPGQLNAGYQDYVDEKIEEGDRIDINTTEYRFIGYFTSMRKAIELVWNYPLEAARKGLSGEVGLEFAISREGRASRIRVIKSSGYEVLDRAIVDAIKLASPFAPLPEGFAKERLLVSGSFRYVLNAYGSH